MLKSHGKTIFEALGRRPIHPFPARMAPGIALDALGSNQSLRVLDPMMGSGTVLAVAKANGHAAFGYDLDPLAVLMAGVWTQTIKPLQILKRAEEVLNEAKIAFRTTAGSEAYPSNSDEETRRFIRFWFDPYSRRQLAALSKAIHCVKESSVRRVLWCGFSRLIITKQAGASLAMDLSHSRPHKAFKLAPVKPFDRFLSAVKIVVENCPTSKNSPVTKVKLGDARKLNIEANSIDLVLTSPPYLNAIDYMRCSKFSLVWMGYNICKIREIRGHSVGAEKTAIHVLKIDWVKAVVDDLDLKPTLSSRDSGLLARYVWDMGLALKEAARVLRPGGRAVYVVGDSTVRGTFISNSSIVEALAKKNGLKTRSRQTRDLPSNRRYLPPPKAIGTMDAMDTRMRREVVLAFEKP